MARINLIAALSQNRVIGCNNQLPWHLPKDLKHFKAITLGHPVVMGRKTYQSLGKALPGRENVVISRDPHFHPLDATVFSNLEAALMHLKESAEIFIIGGGHLFSQTLPIAQRLYLTWIEAELEGDTFFPEWDLGEWIEISRESHSADEKHLYSYSFTLLDRKSFLPE